MLPSNLPSLATRTLKLIHVFEDALLAILLLAMILLASSQVFLRNLFEIGTVWADPLLRIMVLWLGLLGALAASRDNNHISIDILTRYMPAAARRITYLFSSLFTAVVSGIIAYHSTRFVIMEFHAANSAVAGIPTWLLEAIIPVTFFLICVRYLIHFFTHLSNSTQKDTST